MTVELSAASASAKIGAAFDAEQRTPPSFREVLSVFLRIGVLSFGGPAGQIALMHRVLVDEKRWIDEARFLHALNFCMLLPGPEAQQLATYIGWMLHKTRGALTAGSLFVLPGFAVILVLSMIYAAYSRTSWLEGLFLGLKAAVLAIVLQALIRVASRALKGRLHYALSIAAFIAIFALGAPFPLIVLSAGVLGYVIGRWRPEWLGVTSGTGTGSVRPEALPSPSRTFKTLLVGLGLWFTPALLVWVVLGPGVFTAIAVFFAKMAVVTFGGAYAVLAYVAQAAVETYGWLRPDEMIDGIALAETTPGPLILVLSFVGYLAAYRDPGLLAPWMAGILGATLTAWITFAPSMLWILVGAPYIERVRANRALSAALSAITAAVVGVILNLTVWFALHALFRDVGELRFGPFALNWPDLATLDLRAAALSVAAMLLVFWMRLAVGPVLAICGALGWALRYGV